MKETPLTFDVSSNRTVASRCDEIVTKRAPMEKPITQLFFISGGLTSYMLPFDISVNKPFKAFVREEWNRWIMFSNEHQLTPEGAIKQPTVTEVC
jgi:hypothetical protein